MRCTRWSKSTQLLVGEGVGQGQHGHEVGEGLQPVDGLAAHGERGGVRAGVLRESGLQELELAEQEVVRAVVDLGCVELVVETVVADELVGEPAQASQGGVVVETGDKVGDSRRGEGRGRGRAREPPEVGLLSVAERLARRR